MGYRAVKRNVRRGCIRGSAYPQTSFWRRIGVEWKPLICIKHFEL
jgi:hypothetical protein